VTASHDLQSIRPTANSPQ